MRRVAAALLVASAFAGCSSDDKNDSGASVRELLDLPPRFELPAIPESNPLTAEKIKLGRFLFYDKRLSGNQTQSCSSCHHQELAFADGLRLPQGSTGQTLNRNSPGLANVGYHSTLTWSNNGLLSLEDQIPVPIRADNPVELGVSDGNVDEVLARFDGDARYQELFTAAFPRSESGATVNKVVMALASFVRTIISGDSAYDRYKNGDESALDESQRRGLSLFNGERLECFHCHHGVLFSVSYHDANTTPGTIQYPFFNNGLYNVGGDGSYPSYDQGLYELTLNPKDRGMFRPSSLRNVALTAPYMHDGSLPTLRDVILHYSRGGTVTESGPYAGDGRLSPLKSGLVRGFEINEQEIQDVIAFLNALTDESLLTNPKLADPFLEESP
ncbi:MAG: di-heme enzyme [Polyangiaceae bacterium]|nr:di-heme enzyme [Myxococcales bacterium]MCB9589885.1 di-heme enzyme [Polyangiaceae bacterium]